jgi:hypothetical protein
MTWRARLWLAAAVLPALSCAQTSAPPANVLSLIPPDRTLQAHAGGTLEARLGVELRSGYHVNSNTPAEAYLIPLRLTWNPAPLAAAEVLYPKPKMERYSFSKVPLSVFTGDFSILTRFKVPSDAPAGPATLTGRLRYQACNDRMCLAPKNLDVKVQVEIVK